MTLYGAPEPPTGTRVLAAAVLIVLFIVITAVLFVARGDPGGKDDYSVGYQIGPYYLGTSTWEGTPYALSCTQEGVPACRPPVRIRDVGVPDTRASEASASRQMDYQDDYHQMNHQDNNHHKDGFHPFAPPDDGPRGTKNPPSLIYTPEVTSDLRGAHPNWWRSDGGTYGLPVAADRPDFWAGDATIHTYRACDSIPQLCDPAAVKNHDRRLTSEEWVEKWRYYGGPKGWNMSPYY